MQTLNKTLVTLASKAGQEFYDLTIAKGGLGDTREAYDEKKSGASMVIFKLARRGHSEAKGDKDLSLNYFRALCDTAEGRIKEAGQGDNVKEICQEWPVFKSNIVKSLKKGLDPTKHKSLGALNTARTELSRSQAQPDAAQAANVVEVSEQVAEDNPFMDCLKELVTVYGAANEAQRAIILTEVQAILTRHSEAQAPEPDDKEPEVAEKDAEAVAA